MQGGSEADDGPWFFSKKEKTRAIEAIMQPAFPFVDISTGIEALATMITPETPAVLVRDFVAAKTYILTGSDVLAAI